MGLIDIINGIGASFRDTFAIAYDYKCSQCVKCKQCVKTLSDGVTQVRVFTCPGCGNYDDGTYIDDLLRKEKSDLDLTKMSLEYIDAFQKNREEIDNYINSSSVIYVDSAKPLPDYNYHVITTLTGLQSCRTATTCSFFRPFVNWEGILAEPDALTARCLPDLDEYRLSELSKEDKFIITQDYQYPY